jgi:hypothetical protein
MARTTNDTQATTPWVAGLLSAPVIENRFRETEFLDEAERERAWKALVEDAQLWRD